MKEPAIQDSYPDDLSHCYGCGRLNEHGLRLQSHVEGDEVVAVFHPKPYHVAIPGYVYGGLIASIIDCHSMAAASAAALGEPGGDTGDESAMRFVTASLDVKYLKPTPLGVPVEVRARVTGTRGRKTMVSATVSAGGELCARGEVIAARIPDSMLPKPPA